MLASRHIGLLAAVSFSGMVVCLLVPRGGGGGGRRRGGAFCK